jgi:putative ABC transport system permease protein
MLRHLPLIWKNSLRNRRRSLLTIFSIAASFCLLGLLFALYRGLFLSDPTPAQALRLVTRHRVSLTQALPVSHRNRIKSIPGVKEVMLFSWFGGTYKDSRDQRNFFARFAAEPDKVFRVFEENSMPEDQKQAFLRQRTACIVSEDLAKKFKWKVGEKITLKGDIYPVDLELTLVGIYKTPTEGTETLLFNNEYLRELLLAGSQSGRADTVGTFYIQVNTADDATRVSKAVDDMFDNSPYPTKTENEQAFALSFAQFIGNLKVFLLAICGAVTFTILLVSANTMAMSVRERIRDVGVLKTLGYTSGAILGIILGEAAVISLLGGMLGMVFAQGLTAMARQAPAFIAQVKTLSITPPVMLFSLGLAVFIGVVSAFVPAYSASRTPILDTLRYSG